MLRIGMGLILLLLAAPAWSRDWPEVPAPPASKVEWVARHMIYNGIAMRVQSFESRRSASEVLAYYQQKWAGRNVVNPLGPWTVIGTRAGDYYLTVQVRSRGDHASQGYIGISNMPSLKHKPKLGRGFPMMENTQVIDDIRSVDDSREARTLLVLNRYSVESNALFYRKQMTLLGWRRTEDRTAQPGRARVLMFQKGAQQTIISLERQRDQTAVVANLVSGGP